MVAAGVFLVARVFPLMAADQGLAAVPVHALTAVAVVEWNEDLSESEIAITLEHKALGPPEVRVRFLGSVEWPTSTVIPDISDRIVELERTGGLP